MITCEFELDSNAGSQGLRVSFNPSGRTDSLLIEYLIQNGYLKKSEAALEDEYAFIVLKSYRK